MKKKIVLVLFMLVCCLQAKNVNASELGFSVVPILPDNQRNENTFFDLLVKKDTQQTLAVVLTNDTNQPVEVEIAIHNATTNMNGVVEYGESNYELDETAPFSLEDVLQLVDSHVVIPKNSQKKVEFSLKIPDESFAGVVAGGLTFSEVKASKENAGTGMYIENKYAYVIGTLVRENEDVVTSDIDLTAVDVTQINYKTAIVADIQNKVPKYVNQVSVATKITPKGKDTVLYQSENEMMQIAPNTTFSYPTMLEGEKLSPGNYTLALELTSGEENWQFSKDFTISRKVANKYNKTDVEVTSNPTNYVLIGSLCLVVIAILFFVKGNKRRHEEQN